jgi:hypothetical protein
MRGPRESYSDVILRRAKGERGIRRPKADTLPRSFSMTPKPPMFPSPTHGLPLPVQFLARARLFMGAAGDVAYVNGEMNWPKYALLLQSIELALKSFCLRDGRPSPKGLDNHDLKGWYDFARTCGLPSIPNVGDSLEILTPVHLDSSARYPNHRPIYELAGIADETAHAIVEAVGRMT